MAAGGGRFAPYFRLLVKICKHIFTAQRYTNHFCWSKRPGSRAKCHSQEKSTLKGYSLLGSGSWARTSDLIVTLIPYFRMRVDYLIIHVSGCGALMNAYCWAHILVSEPSKTS